MLPACSHQPGVLKQYTGAILTHQDIDHVGSLHDLVQASGAQVLAHATEVPFIDGTEPPRFARPEVLAQRPEMRAVAEQFQMDTSMSCSRTARDLDLAGGVQVVFTPGHTPGHCCLYLERSKTRFAGDALTSSEGRLQGPNEGATSDRPPPAARCRSWPRWTCRRSSATTAASCRKTRTGSCGAWRRSWRTRRRAA